MDQDPLSHSYQAVQMASVGVGMGPINQSQTSEHAKAPSCLPSQTYNRTPIRKMTTPSCNLCRRRKVKCDRADPCSHCVRVGAACVSTAPSGAPRGRKGGRRKLDSELLDRIAKLENLLKQGTPGVTQAVPAVAEGNWTVWHPVLLSTSVFWSSAYVLHY